MKHIVTVTCTRDLNQMVLQSHSIDKFITVPITHHVFIEDLKTPYKSWVDALQPHYKSKHKLIIHYNTLPNEYLENDGWARQQVLKLLAVNFTKHDYLVLDSKNFFIKSHDLNSSIHEGIFFRHTYDEIYPTLKPFASYMLQLREKPLNMYVTITPFLMRQDTVFRIMKEHDIMELFATVVNKGIRPSEFILYSFYCDFEPLSMVEDDWDNEYEDAENFHTWWWDSEIEPNKFENIYNKRTILGIHKNVWAVKENKLNLLASWLISKGLSKTYVNQATIDNSFDSSILKTHDDVYQPSR